MLRKLVLLVALLCGIASAQQTSTGTTTPVLDPGVIYSTGNIVQQTTTSTGSTWTGAVYQDQLTCWAWGDPGYCGPQAIVRPGNNLNFSYGSTYVYQQQHITNILPSGSGLQVNGYNFSFTAKNGNGWDDGRTDSLTALVRFWDNTGGKAADNLLYGTSYNLNYKFNWTTFNYSETFNKPLAATDIGLVQYGFIGRDNNGWAGPYGPEIYNINFSVKYSVDPCATNPLYSPTCPGYMDALNKLVPQTTTTSTATLDPVASTTTNTAAVVTEPVAQPTTNSTTSTGQPTAATPVVSAPAPATTTASSTSSTSSSSSSQSTKESSGTSGGNVSLALSVISKNSERDAAGAAVAQSAVAQAQAAATQAQQEAANVASSAVANSMSASIVSINGMQSNGTGIRMNSNSTNSSISLQSSSTNNFSIAGSMLSPQVQNMSVGAPSIMIQLDQPQQMQQTMLQTNNAVTQSIESYSVVPPNFLTDKTNPITDIIEGKQTVLQNNTTVTQGASVNKNASDNDVAGGVTIAKLAVNPAGYSDYLNLAIRDAAFYAPKEVYKNQRNVDNARALRQLSSDSKHREMVEQQYRGN